MSRLVRVEINVASGAEPSRSARPTPILAHRPCATATTRARNRHRAVGAVDKRAILFSRQIRERELDDRRRYRLDAGEAVVDCRAELQAGAAKIDITAGTQLSGNKTDTAVNARGITL